MKSLLFVFVLLCSFSVAAKEVTAKTKSSVPLSQEPLGNTEGESLYSEKEKEIKSPTSSLQDSSLKKKEKWQGIAIHSEAKYHPGFSHLEYANPKAPKGGKIVVGWNGSFDTLNPFSAKGLSPLLIERLLYQSLGEKSLDEPFTQYPLLAESFYLAEDRLSMVVTLKENAKFSDGRSVTTEDVAFSFKLFRSEAVNAFYKSYWADIKSVEIINKRKFRFIFSKYNPELPAIATELTILPKHIFSKGDFGKDYASIAVGSGPYTVKSFKRGSHIIFERKKDFWAKDDPFFKGRYNFDEIEVRYYKDDTARVEDFKSGSYDIYICYSSKVWARDLAGKAFDNKWAKKELWEHENNQGSQGFYFNLRRPMFQDIKVRKAIALAFDFPWTNRTLFFDQYTENESFFENSVFKSEGLPSQDEFYLLTQLKKEFADDLPDDVFYLPTGSLGEGLGKRLGKLAVTKLGESYKVAAKKPLDVDLSIKQRLKQARVLLQQAGYKAGEDGVLFKEQGEQKGLRLDFKFLLSSESMERVVEPYVQRLKDIGIEVGVEVKESSVYQRKLQSREFDMLVLSIGQSQSPGNEQIDLWHSNAADQKFSRNHYGLKNKAVDHLVDKIIYAENRKDLIFYTKLLDRVLYHLHIVVHNWHSESHRVALWDRYGRPEGFPKYYYPTALIEFLWWDQSKASRLALARKK